MRCFVSVINKTIKKEKKVIVIQPAVSGDDYSILHEEPRGNHIVDIYETFSHLWRIRNTGIVPWHNRYIMLQNKDSIRIKATQEQFDIPDLMPNESIALKVDMDARYFEGTFTLIWEIKLSDGTICFPNKTDEFSFDVTVKSNI